MVGGLGVRVMPCLAGLEFKILGCKGSCLLLGLHIGAS